MKRLLLLGLLLFATSATFSTELILPILKVYDGDTIKTQMPLPAPLNKIGIRVFGIDTPEMGGRAKCNTERELALKAKAVVEKLALSHSYMIVTNFEWDKFGGRIVGTVHIGDANVAPTLLEAGLAYPYFGEKKNKYRWCPESSENPQ